MALGCRFIWCILLLLRRCCTSFHQRPCHRATRAQFQRDDCYVPPLDPDLLLSNASFLMSHNAATGYIQPNQFSKSGLSWWYSKNQVGSVYQQLSDGARALDLRPKLLNNGTVIFHHGEINIPITYERLLADAMRWCKDNPDELVLLLPSHFAYESAQNTQLVTQLTTIYNQLGVPYYKCTDVYQLTIQDVMDMAHLPNNGGYMIAMDGQDYYGTFCGKSNWVERQLVTCYPNSTLSCKKNAPALMQKLTNYMLLSANNAATDDTSVLGPPRSLYKTPLNEIQALWQVTTASAVFGMSHMSSILQDDQQSHLHEHVLDMLYQQEFDRISLLAVDQVHYLGHALLSVLRNQCGQSTAVSVRRCGRQLDPPRLSYLHLTQPQWIGLSVTLYVLWLVTSALYWQRPRVLFLYLTRVRDEWNMRRRQERADRMTHYALAE